ncbi:unnamed protein product [Prorocentrum cordatum]|uniref:H(+)-exporting diphosphatase n=1 Tax=Prorocentrum cordatum TaxID=2364126 RepID=A0ABN9W6S2_9DINO|nr:unnamed protein product [Polarella glacialis]
MPAGLAGAAEHLELFCRPPAPRAGRLADHLSALGTAGTGDRGRARSSFLGGITGCGVVGGVASGGGARGRATCFQDGHEGMGDGGAGGHQQPAAPAGPPAPPDPSRQPEPTVAPEAFSSQMATDTVAGGPGRPSMGNLALKDHVFAAFITSISVLAVGVGIGWEFIAGYCKGALAGSDKTPDSARSSRRSAGRPIGRSGASEGTSVSF